MEHSSLRAEQVRAYHQVSRLRNSAELHRRRAKVIRGRAGFQAEYCRCLTFYAELMRQADKLVKELPLVVR